MGQHGGRPSRVSCPRNNMPFVAIKMGRRQGGPSRTGVRGRIRSTFYIPGTLGLSRAA
jgi:hypothetical protein